SAPVGGDHRAEIHATTRAQQEIRGTLAEAVFPQRLRVARVEGERTGRIRDRDRPVRPAEAALAGTRLPVGDGDRRAVDEADGAAMAGAAELACRCTHASKPWRGGLVTRSFCSRGGRAAQSPGGRPGAARVPRPGRRSQAHAYRERPSKCRTGSWSGSTPSRQRTLIAAMALPLASPPSAYGWMPQ